jgi:hypothetical protein
VTGSLVSSAARLVNARLTLRRLHRTHAPGKRAAGAPLRVRAVGDFLRKSYSEAAWASKKTPPSSDPVGEHTDKAGAKAAAGMGSGVLRKEEDVALLGVSKRGVWYVELDRTASNASPASAKPASKGAIGSGMSTAFSAPDRPGLTYKLAHQAEERLNKYLPGLPMSPREISIQGIRRL